MQPLNPNLRTGIGVDISEMMVGESFGRYAKCKEPKAVNQQNRNQGGSRSERLVRWAPPWLLSLSGPLLGAGLLPRGQSEVAQSCLTLCDPMDYSPPGSSVHGISQARILEWVAISFSRGSSQSRDQTRVSHIAGRRFTIWATREAPPRGQGG